MKRFFFIFFLLLTTFDSFSQVKLNVWESEPTVKSSNLVSTTIDLPKTFVSKLPDGKTDIYERIYQNSISVTTSTGESFTYTPISYASKSNSSFITYSDNGWTGWYDSKEGKSYSLFYGKTIKDTTKQINSENCSIVFPESKTGRTPSISNTTNWSNSEFYNRLEPIKKVCTIYFQVSWDVYNGLQQNQSNILSYMNNVFLGINYLFKREGILFKLNKIHITNTPDEYTAGIGCFNFGPNCITSFKSKINSSNPVQPNAHFKMLFDLGFNGNGIAVLSTAYTNGYETLNPSMDALNACSMVNLSSGNTMQPNPTSPTDINTYNLQIRTAVHELGHNFSARHTHWCGWKNNIGTNTGPIDSCSTIEKYGAATGSVGCNSGSSDGGGPIVPIKNSPNPTIMSYCDLVFPATKLPILKTGFGKYPPHAIRSNLYLSTEIPFVEYQTPPTVLTYNTASGIGINSANSGGIVSDTGGAPFMIRGLIWSTNSNLDIYTATGYDIATNGTLGSYLGYMTGLNPSTTYYFRAFASNLAGVSYGQVVQFTTLSAVLPTITSNLVSKTNTSITINGSNLTSGGAQILDKGVIWSTSSTNLTYNLQTKIIAQSTDLSPFTISISNLAPNTTYYIRTFVRSSFGIGYSNTLTVQTFSSNNILFGAIITRDILAKKAKFSLPILSNGQSPITQRGFCWSTTPNPTINNSKTQEGGGMDTITSIIRKLTPQTTYYLRGYAQNTQGVAYTTQITFTTKKLTYSIVESNLNNNTFWMKMNVDTDDGPLKYGTITSSNLNGPYTNPRFMTTGFPQNPFSGDLLVGNGSVQFFPSPSTVYIKPIIQDKFQENDTGSVAATVSNYWNCCSPKVYSIYNKENTQTSMKFGGDLTLFSAPSIIERGVLYRLGGLPLYNNQQTVKKTVPFDVPNNIPLGKFEVNVTGLTSGGTYWVCAFTKNSEQEIGYGDPIIVKLPANIPTITTSPTVTNITGTSGTVSGQLLNSFGQTILEMGICYSTFQNVSINSTKSVLLNNTTQPFSINLFGLGSNVTYYYRSYVITSETIAYGELRSFATLATIPVVRTVNIQDIDMTAAVVKCERISAGGVQPTEAGAVFSTSPNPTLTNSTKKIYTGNPNDESFFVPITGLTPNTLYYARGYVTNPVGTGYGEIFTFRTTTTPLSVPILTTTPISNLGTNSATTGGNISYNGTLPIIENGIFYSTSPNFQYFPGSTVLFSDPNQNPFTVNIPNLLPNTTYYMRSFARNSFGRGLGNVVSFTTLAATTPNLRTNTPVIGGQNTIISGGTILSPGNSSITSKGVIWSTSNSNITIDLPTKTNNGGGPSNYSSTVTGLTPGNTYHFKSYAINNSGVGYGELKSIFLPAAGSSNCLISSVTINQPYKWTFKFNLNTSCNTYRIQLAKYNANPTLDPNLYATQVQILNGFNPLAATSSDISLGYIERIMSPQPKGDPLKGIWYGLIIDCNGSCLTGTTRTRTYFYVPPQ